MGDSSINLICIEEVDKNSGRWQEFYITGLSPVRCRMLLHILIKIYQVKAVSKNNYTHIFDKRLSFQNTSHHNDQIKTNFKVKN